MCIRDRIPTITGFNCEPIIGITTNEGKIEKNSVLDPRKPANKAPKYPNSAKFSMKI